MAFKLNPPLSVVCHSLIKFIIAASLLWSGLVGLVTLLVFVVIHTSSYRLVDSGDTTTVVPLLLLLPLGTVSADDDDDDLLREGVVVAVDGGTEAGERGCCCCLE